MLMRKMRWLLWSILPLLLTGCLGELLQSKVDEPLTYLLSPQSSNIATVAYDAELAVTIPNALPALDTTRIALLRDGNRIDYVYGARWGGTAPQLVQNFMVSLLRSHQGLRSVVAEGARVDAGLLLQLELRDFQAEYLRDKTEPQAHVTLVATLLDIHQRRVLGTFEQTASVAATENRQGAIVQAFQSALQQSGLALANQLSTQLAKSSSAAGPVATSPGKQ